eukprot:6190636-Pleurochrysis_carterae.AAC.1
MAPPELTPRTQSQPARDTADTPDRNLRRRNSILTELHDPAKFLDLQIFFQQFFVDPNDNTRQHLLHQNTTPEHSLSTVGIGQQSSTNDSLSNGNLWPENPATLTASTAEF